MKRIILFLFAVSYLASCKETGGKSGDEVGSNVDSVTYFQVGQYIGEERDAVKKTPFFIYKKTESNGHVDSVAINTNEFLQLSQTFLQPDINDPKIKKSYSENIFFDETTKTFSITYSAKDKSLEIQNVNIILMEDGKTVKRIFIRKFYDYSDSSAIEQLGWKPGESFQINRLVTLPEKEDKTTLTTVTWNEK